MTDSKKLKNQNYYHHWLGTTLKCNKLRWKVKLRNKLSGTFEIGWICSSNVVLLFSAPSLLAEDDSYTYGKC